MNEVVVVGAKRSAIGNFGGSLKDIDSVNLGVLVLKDVLDSLNLDKKEIDEVIIGNVLSAGLGQNIARQIAIYSGLNELSHAFSVNEVCGSGLKSIELGFQSILLGNAEMIACGGVENMSQSPFLSKDSRFGKKMGNFELVDSVIFDGLWDKFNNYHMGITAENIAKKFNISREKQDIFALNSQQKALNAIKNKKFSNEITPINIESKKEKITFKVDEFVKSTSLEALSKLRPAFNREGSVSAGNSSGINDGASIVILSTLKKSKSLGLKPLARVKGFGNCGCSPEIMGMGPVGAIQKVLKKTELDLKDISLFEINEAFAAQSIAVLDTLGLDYERVNVNGGAISLGHPIGASGARIFTTLIHEMQNLDLKFALASLCVGGGQGIACVLEKFED